MILGQLIAQLPPTPTRLPPVAPEDVAMGLQFDGFSLWDVAPHAIQWWNSASVITVPLQVFILVLMVLGSAMVLIKFFKASEPQK